jgi:hypothetical protein
MNTAESFAETIAGAMKALVTLTKQLTNLVGLVQKNVESYWKLKDAAGRRKAANDLRELSRQFAHLGFLQQLMAYESGSRNDAVIELVTTRLDEYAVEVDKLITSVEKQFPELIKSDGMSKALRAALDKKKLVGELRNFLQTSSKKQSPVFDEVKELVLQFNELAHQSFTLAKIIGAHAEEVSRPPGRGKKSPA